jgi:PAS domain S-box-containing protein
MDIPLKHLENFTPRFSPPMMAWDLINNELQNKYCELDDQNFLRSFFLNKTCLFPEDVTNAVKNYDAIIITDLKQVIQWVSSGFLSMTGYTRFFALNKKPNFLQGPESNEEINRKIRTDLENLKPTHAQVLNYRRSGEEYICDIHIEPVFNRKRELINFIAFEKEIPPGDMA